MGFWKSGRRTPTDWRLQWRGVCLGCLTILLSTDCSIFHHREDLVVDEALLTRYSELARPVANSAATSTDIDCFLDYSLGMGEGMRATASINASLKNFLGGRTVTYYKVGVADDPPQIDINSPAANLIDLNNYKEPASKLKVAVDRMTAHKNKVSLFITDFERVEDVSLKQNLPGAPGPHPIDASAWAQNDFKDWLTAGNQIDVFAVQFAKPDYWFDKSHAKYPNWIYTLVFTPGAIVNNDAAFKSSVVPFLSEAYRAAGANDYKHFTYTANAFAIEPGSTSSNGNANENVIVQSSFTTTSPKGFEFYEFASDDLVKFNGDATQKDKRIINKLRVTSQIPFFSDTKFGINVHDVTQPLANLYKSASQAAAPVTTDPETGKTSAAGTKAATPSFEPGQPAESVFDFVYNVGTKEVGIKLSPDFSGVAQTSVYKVDVILVSSTKRDFNESDQVMALNYGGGYAIRSLGDSVKLAVRDVAAGMDGKVLYSFFIKINK